MKELIFFTIFFTLIFFLFVYLPNKNKQSSMEDMIPINEDADNARELCREFHHNVWMETTGLMGIEYCPVCERYRSSHE